MAAFKLGIRLTDPGTPWVSGNFGWLSKAPKVAVAQAPWLI
jgi:hypothetical protein